MNITAYFYKGKHRYSLFFLDWLRNLFPTRLKAKKIKVEFMIHESCWYLDPQEPGQINKLFGFSSWLIHRNSWRLGWKPNPYHEPFEKSFLLYSYIYQNGKRYEQLLKIVNANVWHTVYIPEYELHTRLVWHCFPYFGGKLPAPNNCFIKIRYD